MTLHPGETWLKPWRTLVLPPGLLVYFAFIPIEPASALLGQFCPAVEACRQIGSAQSSDFSRAVLSLPRTADPSRALEPAVTPYAFFWCGDYALEVQGHPSQFKGR